jgi:DNA-binding PadR family transcriptional regulator
MNHMKPDSQDKTTQSWIKEAKKGYIRLGVLILLSKKPAHGYELMKEIDQRTQGFWRPTAGGVYPILNNLENAGFIKGHWETQKNRRLKVYTITPSGDAILKRAIRKQAEIFNNLSSLFNEFARDVLHIQETIPTPTPPSPFTPFLEDKNSQTTLQQLEVQRKLLTDHLRTVREQLNATDAKIVQLKKQSNPDSEQ